MKRFRKALGIVALALVVSLSLRPSRLSRLRYLACNRRQYGKLGFRLGED